MWRSSVVVVLAEVLKVLASHAESGRWWSVRDLSREAGVTYESARKALRHLLIIGLLQKRDRKGEGGGHEVRLQH